MENTNRSQWQKNILRTLIAALSFFFLLGSYYIIKSTRKPLLFAHVGKDYLHHFYNISAVVTLVAIVGYNQLVNRFPRTKLLRVLYSFVIGVFLCMAVAFHWIGSQPAYDAVLTTFYFFFVSLYFLFMAALFWSFNHDLHKTEDAKKFYPYIFLGGQVGIIFAGKFTSYFLGESTFKSIGLNDYSLLIIASALSLAIAWVFLEIFKIFDPNLKENTYAKPQATGTLDDIELFVKSKYVLCLGLIVVLATFTSTISDLQFSWLMDDSILKDESFYKVKSEDMLKQETFLAKLKEQQDPVSQYLYQKFSPETQQKIQQTESVDATIEAIVKELNVLLPQEKLYSQQRFSQITLPDTLSNYLQQEQKKPKAFLASFFTNHDKENSDHIFMQNKLLLSEVYPYNFVTFTPKQIHDNKIIEVIQNEEKPLNSYILSLFSEKTKQLLAENSEDSLVELCYAFSEIIKKESFYDASFFAWKEAENSTENKNIVVFSQKKFHKITYSKRISKNIHQDNTGKDSIILNRLLLQESYSQLENTQISLQGKMWAEMDAKMGVLNILMCLVITPLLIYLLGPAIGICLYPVVIFIGGIFFIQELSIYIVQYFAIAALCLNYTLYKVGSEIFYVPTDKVIKYKVKAVCDTFIFRVGDMGSSIVVMIYLWFGVSLNPLSYLVFIVVFFWIMVILRTGKKYQELLEKTEVQNEQ